jgi:phosphoribosylformylglycinamidine synthase
VPGPESLTNVLETLLGSSHLCSRRWVWEQYDHMVMADTVQRPGGDAAVVRVHGTNKGLAASSDVTPRYCAADPREGGKQAVAEVWRTLTATGALPLAITDCLNFGNPERPEVMGQFVGCIEGMAEACRAFDFPVVSGNVSLYNETDGKAIPPTPAIGGIGLIPELDRMATMALKAEGETLLLLGAERGHLGQSLYMWEIRDESKGAPPPVDLEAERRTGDFVRSLIGDASVTAVHDLSDGGLLVALAEMAMSGGVGVTMAAYGGPLPLHAVLFGEDQGRYLISLAEGEDEIASRAMAAGIPARTIGRSGGDELRLSDEIFWPIQKLKDLHEAWLPDYMKSI